MKRRLVLAAVQVLVLAAAVGGWQLATDSANDPFFLPPSQIVPTICTTCGLPVPAASVCAAWRTRIIYGDGISSPRYSRNRGF